MKLGLFHTMTIILPVIALVLLVLQLVVANDLAIAGQSVGKLDERIADMKKQNELLAVKVASASSLTTISNQALALGFKAPEAASVLSLSPQAPVALK